MTVWVQIGNGERQPMNVSATQAVNEFCQQMSGFRELVPVVIWKNRNGKELRDVAGILFPECYVYGDGSESYFFYWDTYSTVYEYWEGWNNRNLKKVTEGTTGYNDFRETREEFRQAGYDLPW